MTTTYKFNSVKNDPKLWLAMMPKLTTTSNKYERGVSVIVGGYPITGASRLSAYASARVGSGLTSLIVPSEAFSIYASAVTSIMVKAFVNIEEFDLLIKDPRNSCFLIGPGAGISKCTMQQTIHLINTKKPVVIDADALTVFKDKLSELSNITHSNCVLTPHEGEFKRLFALNESREICALAASKLTGAVIVLKGHQTVIASPDGRVFVNNNAPPLLATGGAGDVLAGLITGLIAQGMPSFYASAAAVWIHGEAAKLFGIGLVADDLPNLIPKVLKKIYAKAENNYLL
jgi:ADP-dependent NAD(P)H-hydrate dehydratase / NAD(P)H-hydrate epimerase